ncbi:hypothetical protein GOV05_03710 [Candidatus Woesearchaeota archaeon]|nr:hypothetical protein [Candidatus Woesearchaeota archaeon]
MFVKKRKAQVTLFIIIGMVLLISVLIYFGIEGKLSYFDPEAIIAPDKTAVKNYVEACLRQTAQEAVTLVAFQGGYAKLTDRFEPHQGGNYQEFVGGGFKIPYWHSNGIDFTPTRELLGKNIALYIDSRLNACLQDLEPLRAVYDVNATKPPKSSVSIGRGRITVDLDYPVLLRTLKKRGDTLVNDYRTSVNSQIFEAYDLAKLIRDDYIENNRLYNFTMEIIAGSELPYKGYEFNCHDRTWSMTELEQEFNSLTNANLRFIKYVNTRNAEFETEYPACAEPGVCDYTRSEYYDKRYLLDVGADDKHKRFSVSITPFSTTRFEVFPNTGGFVKSLDIQLPVVGNLIDPCVNLFNHFYTVDYAVKYSITDEDGLRFNFILPVNVLYNDQKTTFSLYNPYFDDDILYYMNNTLSVTNYCQGAEHEVVVVVEDKVSGKGILNASLYYECISFRCAVGQTDYIRTRHGIVISRTTLLRGMFPECINGNLIVDAENYIPRNDIVLTPREQLDSLLVQLKPIVEVPVSFESVSYNAQGVASITDYLDEDSYIIVFVTNDDIPHSEASTFVPGQGMSLSDFKIRIPLNDSYENNITIDVKVIDEATSISTAGYYYKGTFDGRSLSIAENIELVLITQRPQPTTQDAMIDMYKDVVFEYSDRFRPKINY